MLATEKDLKETLRLGAEQDLEQALQLGPEDLKSAPGRGK